MNSAYSFTGTKSFVIAAITWMCMILECTYSQAQGIRATVYSAYVFDDHIDSYYGSSRYYNGKIIGGYQWGFGVEYMLRPEYGIELLYLRQDTHAPTEYSENGITLQRTDFDLDLNYIMVGGSRHLVSSNEKIEGFAGLMAGVVVADLKNPDNFRQSSATKFSWGVRAGGILWTTDRLGIKLQAQLLSAVQAMGGGFYFGTGGGGADLTSYSTIYQFSLGGGLVLKIRS